VVTRTVEAKPQVHYSPSNAGSEMPLAELVRAGWPRWGAEGSPVSE
jgi:hypothetical protein